MVRRMLLSRGIEVSDGFPSNVPGFGESPEAAIVAAAFSCDGEQDFHARIRGHVDRTRDRGILPAGVLWRRTAGAGEAAPAGIADPRFPPGREARPVPMHTGCAQKEENSGARGQNRMPSLKPRLNARFPLPLVS